VATALRQGAKNVFQLQHNPRPPDQRPPNNPWPQWPRIHRMEYGHEEAEALFGIDPRVFEIQTVALEGADNRVARVSTVGITWEKGQSGERRAQSVPGTQRQLEADMVILAMGFRGPEPLLSQELAVPLDSHGNFQTAADGHSTALPGVFVAGDCKRGQSLVVWAIREGRQAAQACDRFLSA
jgi:NADPH-dependent glutamate synthase beta subunit-like oxidoreductase